MRIPFTNYELKPVHELEAAVSESTDLGDAYYDRNFKPSAGTNLVSQQNWHRAVTRCQNLSQNNGMFRRILEILADHTHGNGVENYIETNNPDLKGIEQSIKEIADKTLFGSHNRIDLKLYQMIYEQFQNGEVCLPVFTNEYDGSVTLGYLPALWIADVELNAEDISDVRRVQIRQGEFMFDPKAKVEKMNYGQNHGRWLNVVKFDRDPYERDEKGGTVYEDNLPKANPDFGMLKGDVFYFRTGNLIGQPRGQGDGFAIADFAIILEQGVYDFLRRYDIKETVVYDLLVRGANDAAIQKLAASIVLPTGRKPFIHNEKSELKMMSSSTDMGQLVGFIRQLVTLIGGSVGIPHYMLGDGSMSNVATAKEQAPALYAKFGLRRKLWEANLSYITRFAVQEANRRGMLYITRKNEAGVEEKTKIVLTNKELDSIEIGVKFLPFERNNTGETSAGYKNIVEAAALGVETGMTSKDKAREIVASQASTLGISIDPETERKQIQTEKGQLVGTTPTGKLSNMTDLT